MLLLQQMSVLFLFMILGFFCGKRKVLTDEATKAISWIVVNIANPALILSASVSGTATMKGAELLKVFGIAILVFVFLIVISAFLPFVLRVPAEDKGVFRVMTIFSNISKILNLALLALEFSFNSVSLATIGFLFIILPKDL